jgi:hypothetical protein
LSIQARERHVESVPSLSAPTIALGIDDASSGSTAAQIFSHGVLSKARSTMGSPVIGNGNIRKFHGWIS